jgi:hypothetical protein
MKQYQSRWNPALVLPSAVYYQCIWVVKDMVRLEEIAKDGFRNEMLNESSCGYVAETGSLACALLPEQEEALFKLDCIHRAIILIPEEYREGILMNIQNRGSGYGDFAHENTWKKWKQRFIYALAVNLKLVSPRI